MTTAATSLLGLALPVTGELSGTWGDTVNNSITALLDSAVAGTTTLSADADVTLTTTTLAANQAREAIILWTAAGTVTRYITAPAQSKTYVVLNKSSTQSIVLRGVGPTTGVTILAGKQAMVAWDGTDYVEISSGYVDGPATSTDNAVARFDGTDGKNIQNSVVTIADTTGNMTGVGTLSSGAITSSSLTATRVLFAGTAGLIQDDADLTFNGTILTSTGFAGALNGTVGATTPAAGSFTNITGSANAIISVTDNTNAALRITQLGSGNALLVEDSTNPDATPFVIDSVGSVVVGHTANIATVSGLIPAVSSVITGAGQIAYSTNRFQDDVTDSKFVFNKARGTVSAPTIVASADGLGKLWFAGYDGAGYIRGALIEAAVDGTPGTNDMPGRLVFSTTADGASSPTERMRIGSTGQTTISGNTIVSVTDNTNAALRITQLGTGNALLVEDSANPDATPFVINNGGQTTVGNTSEPWFISGVVPLFGVTGTSNTTSVAAVSRYSNDANQSWLLFGKSRGAAVGTNTVVQSGDNIGTIDFAGADGTSNISAARITAAVDGTPGTNDMPGRLTFSTTADGASSPTERMRIDSAGGVGIGPGSIAAGYTLSITRAMTGAATAYGVIEQGAIQTDVTTAARYFSSFANGAASLTTGALSHFYAQSGSLGAGSAVTSQYGFVADSSLTGATNNYGFYSNIASGTNRYNFYANGTAVNYFAGNVGIGTTAPGYTLQVSGSLGVTGTTVLGATVNTGLGVSTGDAAIELGASRTGDGNTFIDFHSTASSDYELRVSRASGVNGNASFNNLGTGSFTLQQVGAGTMLFSTNATERMRIDSAGNVGIGGAAANASAILDAQSTTKGVRMPNMTTTQKNAIATPAAGLMVFDTTLAKLCVYTGAAWQTITSV